MRKEVIVRIHIIKDVKGNDEFVFNGDYYECPNCEENIYDVFRYCASCGVKIKWVSDNTITKN